MKWKGTTRKYVKLSVEYKIHFKLRFPDVEALGCSFFRIGARPVWGTP